MASWSTSVEIDQQVKIRGFRVELGEIESAISEHPAVREAVVVKLTIAGNDRLVAYTVLASSDRTIEDELRAQLRRKLPPHMMPYSIEFLDALPLNRNGKVDRQALPAPTFSTAPTAQHPRTSTEERVARVWQDVLCKDRIGPDDNFFESGGQSLLAVRVAVRLREAFGIELPVSRIFEFQTVADLAAYIDSGQSTEGGPAIAGQVRGLPTLTRVSRESVQRTTVNSVESGGEP